MKSPQIAIPRCYDSHVHWQSSGEIQSWISLSSPSSLSSLSFAEELRKRLKETQPQRGSWLLGFGWDQHQWPDSLPIHRKTLDEWQIPFPVLLYRADGHAIWCNTLALEQLSPDELQTLKNSPGGRVEYDARGEMTGVFVDSAKELLGSKIPPLAPAERETYLLEGMELFLKQGFTHIRDVGGCWEDWEQAQTIDGAGKLKIFVEMYFNLDSVQTLATRIEELKRARLQPSAHLRAQGIKFFFDGALGSEGAFLSEPYPSGSRGLQLYPLEEIEYVMAECWRTGLPLAIHTLGDEAVHQVVTLAQKLKQKGSSGELHLEHCEVVRSETIAKMKGLNIHCHLQPSHFLTDRLWLKEKLGSLFDCIFPWQRLGEAGIPIFFGSDSPIEKPSLLKTKEGLEACAKEGIALPLLSPWNYHSHPDQTWGPHCQTLWDGETLVEVKNF